MPDWDTQARALPLNAHDQMVLDECGLTQATPIVGGGVMYSGPWGGCSRNNRHCRCETYIRNFEIIGTDDRGDVLYVAVRCAGNPRKIDHWQANGRCFVQFCICDHDCECKAYLKSRGSLDVVY